MMFLGTRTGIRAEFADQLPIAKRGGTGYDATIAGEKAAHCTGLLPHVAEQQKVEIPGICTSFLPQGIVNSLGVLLAICRSNW